MSDCFRAKPIFISILSVSLLSASGCTHIDAQPHLREAATLSSRVTGDADPQQAWSLPVDGESPAWDGVAPLTAEAAVAVALQSDPQLRAELALICAATADMVHASLPPNPTISFGVGSAIDNMTGAPAMVQGMQVLSWLWTNPWRVQAAEARLQKAIFSAAERCVRHLNDTRELVATVAAGQQTLMLNRQHAQLAHRTAELVREQVNVGELPLLDLGRARLDAEQAQAAAIASDYALLEAKLELLHAMGRAETGVQWVITSPVIPDWPVPTREIDLLDLATTERLDVAAAAQDVIAAMSAAGLARTEQIPELSVMLTWQRNSSDRRALVPGAAVTLPILDDGTAAMMTASAQLEAARMTLLATQENALLEIRNLYSEMLNARAQINSLQEVQLEAAVLNQERTLAAWQAGEIDLTTLLDTQRRRIAVEQALVTQELALARAMCALRTAVGGSFEPAANTINSAKLKSSDRETDS